MSTVDLKAGAIKKKPVSFIKAVTKDPAVFGTIAFASLGGFLFGYDQGLMGGVLRIEAFGAEFPRIYSDPDYKGWCVSTFLLCCWAGSLINSPITQKFGRKKTIVVACIIFIIGSSIQTGSVNDGMLFAGRGVAGLGVGSLTTTVPITMAELTMPELRGGLVVAQQLMTTIGILVAYWVDYGTNYIGGTRCAPDIPYDNGESFNPYTDVPKGGCTAQSTASWRVPLGIQIFPAICLALGMIFFPESPRWLVLVGQDDKAYDILKFLRRKLSDQDIEKEYLEIKAEVLFEAGYTERKFGSISGFALEMARYWDLIYTKAHFKRVFIGSAVMFFQQFIGCNAIIYYAPTIFGQLGLSDNTTSLLGTGLYGIVNCLSTLPAMFLIDRVGRKPLLLSGAVGTFISLVIVAGIVGKYDGQLDVYKNAGRTAIAFIFIYDVNFSYSWAPIGWVLPSEIFPIGIRSKAVSITTSATWMSNFIIGLVTPRMLATMKFGTYIFFAAFALIAFLFTWFIIPETKGVPLEEMDAVFNDIEASGEKQALAEANAKAQSLLHTDSKASVQLSV